MLNERRTQRQLVLLGFVGFNSKMTFWQENYSFIKEVYDTRYSKMVEWMDNVEMAIQKVCASKVYTSAEFKREKDNFHVRKFIFQIQS